MAKNSPNKRLHDQFTKNIFKYKQSAYDFLKYNLPAQVLAEVKLETLELLDGSFIDPPLDEFFSDILYSAQLKQSKTPTYIAFLFEHKSYPDKWVPLQILGYQLRVWEAQVKQKEPLRPVLCFVLYHGQDTWTIKREFTGLFPDLPDALRSYVVEFEYLLYDLSTYSDEEIKGWAILQVGLRLLKYIWHDELADKLEEIIGLLTTLKQADTAIEFLVAVLKYITTGPEKVSPEQIVQVVHKLFNEQGDAIMGSIAERWYTEGREKGREEGREEGRQAIIDTIRQVIAIRFYTELEHFDPYFSQLDYDSVDYLRQRVFDVTSLADFEAELIQQIAEQSTNNSDEGLA